MTGALVYAKAGLLKHKCATTFSSAYKEILAIDPSITIENRRWSDQGKIITSAGVSAEIDVALYLIASLISFERMLEVQKDLEYFPQIPIKADLKHNI